MRLRILTAILLTAALLSGCTRSTVDEMYTPPRRSAQYQELQAAIDSAMSDLEYCAPLSGENQQAVQAADLDGDGEDEYLLFAKSTSGSPLRILIFRKSDDGYLLSETLASRGTAFARVEYIELDNEPGVEIVVGRQLNDQVLRSLSVYSFSGEQSEQLLTTSYSRFVTVDLDSDEKYELLTVSPGTTETDNAVAVLYRFQDGEITRSAEVGLSEPAENIRRIMTGQLYGGTPAVYIASAAMENAIITDVFSLRDGELTNVSLSNESGTSVGTLRNYYVYADDIDGDDVLELPDLITMVSHGDDVDLPIPYLIRWYAMTLDGEEVDKLYTFHNFVGGWYLRLDSTWARQLTVTQEGSTYCFSIWDEQYEEERTVLTLYTFTDADRETEAVSDGRFVLYRGDSVVYAAKLETAAAAYEITQENLVSCFQLIHTDWNTGEI